MEFSHKSSKTASSKVRQARHTDYKLFNTVVAQYLADTADTAVGTGSIDPTQLQEGQSVFDNDGTEQIIVGDPDGTTDKVLMPADQVDTGNPMGAHNVEDTEIASQYSLQSPMGLKMADLVMDLGAGNPGSLLSMETSIEKDCETDGLRVGDSGYVEVMNTIQAMKDVGYETVDIVLNIGELYDRDFGERVLAEARRKGIL